MICLKEIYSGIYQDKDDCYTCYDIYDNETVVGNCYIYTGNKYLYVFGNLGYYIFEKYRNRGFAGETLRQLVHIIFERQIESITVLVKKDNDISKRVLEGNGFVSKDDVVIEGEQFDVYSLLKTETEKGEENV